MNQTDEQASNRQQPMIENSAETESMADLPLTVAQAKATKAEGGATAAAGEFPYIVSFQQALSSNQVMTSLVKS